MCESGNHGCFKLDPRGTLWKLLFQRERTAECIPKPNIEGTQHACCFVETRTALHQGHVGSPLQTSPPLQSTAHPCISEAPPSLSMCEACRIISNLNDPLCLLRLGLWYFVTAAGETHTAAQTGAGAVWSELPPWP